MKASGYVPTTIQQKSIEEEHARHKKRIENILTKKTKEHGSATNLKMSQQLQKNMKAAHNEKFQSIDKDNKFLLEKLIEISRKKPGAVVVEKKEHSHSKSLHGTYRKKEMMRISMENEAFAKRLLAQQSTFDRKKVNNDFKKHQALLVQIKRVSTSPQKNPQAKKLPPLTIEVKTPKKENISLIKSPLAKDINSAKEPATSAPSRDEKTSNRLPESTKEVDNKKKTEEVDSKKKTEEVDSKKKTEEVLPEVQSEKAIDEKNPEPEKVEEPKEDIKEVKEEEIKEVKEDVKEVKEEVKEVKEEEIKEVKEEVKELPKEEVKETPIAEVEEKPVKSQPDVEAQAEEKMNAPVENKPESNSQIGEDLPKEDGEADKN